MFKQQHTLTTKRTSSSPPYTQNSRFANIVLQNTIERFDVLVTNKQTNNQCLSTATLDGSTGAVDCSSKRWHETRMHERMNTNNEWECNLNVRCRTKQRTCDLFGAFVVSTLRYTRHKTINCHCSSARVSFTFRPCLFEKRNDIYCLTSETQWTGLLVERVFVDTTNRSLTAHSITSKSWNKRTIHESQVKSYSRPAAFVLAGEIDVLLQRHAVVPIAWLSCFDSARWTVLND